MKNVKMSTKITVVTWIVITICICCLYIIASRNLTTVMKKSELENLNASLSVETNIIAEYISHQEDLLVAFSDNTKVIEFLKDPTNEEKRQLAQEYTERFYNRLDNWEGLYIGEWDTHVIAHSNPDVVGIRTREGESLEELQNEMLLRNGLYNTGIIVSPASQKLVLSMYCPVFDYDGKTILGYVGGGPFTDGLKQLLVSVEKEDATYYLLNSLTGKYIFAENEALMATEIKDEMLLSILDSTIDNSGVWRGDKDYFDEKNGKSIAVYQYIPEYSWIVVSCNSEKNIFADVNKSMRLLRAICIMSDFIIALLCWLIIHVGTRPLKYVRKSIVQLKELKLQKDHKLDKYIDGKSEIGQIATAIDSLYDSIKDMLEAEKEKQIAIAASESKAKFLANMSHEIRTPINTVIGMNEMILRENHDEAIQEYAFNIKSASEMLLGLINDVLDFSKIEAGKLQIIENDYQVSDMLKDAILGIESRVKQKNLELITEIDDDIPSVLYGDEIRIKQILNNLLSNAVKYTEKGKITFSAKGINDENGFSLRLSVTDTGIGIKKEDMERLFESFLRLEREKNRYIEGTGLGLNITKQLVDNMNGKISVESEHGKGSCFTVYIPQTVIDKTTIRELNLQNKNDVNENHKESNFLYAPHAKVLVVDDNKMNLVVIQKLLKRSQIQLECANSGLECLSMTKSKKYDLILMDHMMPEPDGIQTLHLIREDKDNMNKETNVIVLTANAIAGIEDVYLKEGFVGYLSKPVVVDRLESILSKYLCTDNE